MKNSWKCSGFGLFSCWQLWFHEKNCQKKFGVKNSWKCCGFGLFSCWQLWFQEKNCQKKFGVKNSWKCWVFCQNRIFGQKFDFSNSVFYQLPEGNGFPGCSKKTAVAAIEAYEKLRLRMSKMHKSIKCMILEWNWPQNAGLINELNDNFFWLLELSSDDEEEGEAVWSCKRSLDQELGVRGDKDQLSCFNTTSSILKMSWSVQAPSVT